MNVRTVLITGSSRGIGLSVAKKFLSCGDRVVLNAARSLEELNQAYESLVCNAPGRVYAAPGDVSVYQEVQAIYQNIERRFGSINVLVNNAGVSYVGLFQLMQPEEWRTVLENNILSVVHCSHVVLTEMIKQNKGCIMNISSVWGDRGASCEAIYSASKGAVNGFTRALAKEVGPSNVRVNAISCGFIDTDMNEWMTETEKNDFKEEISLCRFGKPEEVAELVYYLASDAAQYITGQVIGLDGGMV